MTASAVRAWALDDPYASTPRPARVTAWPSGRTPPDYRHPWAINRGYRARYVCDRGTATVDAETARALRGCADELCRLAQGLDATTRDATDDLALLERLSAVATTLVDILRRHAEDVARA